MDKTIKDSFTLQLLNSQTEDEVIALVDHIVKLISDANQHYKQILVLSYEITNLSAEVLVDVLKKLEIVSDTVVMYTNAIKFVDTEYTTQLFFNMSDTLKAKLVFVVVLYGPADVHDNIKAGFYESIKGLSHVKFLGLATNVIVPFSKHAINQLDSVTQWLKEMYTLFPTLMLQPTVIPEHMLPNDDLDVYAGLVYANNFQEDIVPDYPINDSMVNSVILQASTETSPVNT